MCTIGSIFEENHIITYKQCDLSKLTNFYEPEIIAGSSGIKYLKFGREGNSGSWCGINNYGVSLAAADSYIIPELENMIDNTIETSPIFDAYLNVIAQYKDAKAASEFMCEFYRTFPYPDIVIISDKQDSYYIEAFNGEIICMHKNFNKNRMDNYFACTNHFRFIHGAVGYNENHSSYLRLMRAETILSGPQKNIFSMLSDQYYGESVLSICRSNKIVPSGENNYFTQASAVFASNGNIVNCAYLINSNPVETPFTFISNVFNQSVKSAITDFNKLSCLLSTFT